ncbi:uncharacterized protein LOC111989542 isoform X4 [Quercus suber]|uniref:uncharacterized protein LOC111989542 isoform X4 n=1 Tax=Quercus suber TaxID=58331 RepID=UPI0032DE84EA
MAAAARAVWQRTANQCFVQEDAKRTPKLGCCQSSSTTKQVDAGPTNAADGADHPALGFMPCDRNPSLSNPPIDTRWWLQLQPSYGYQKQKGVTYEQLKALEAEVETLRAGTLNLIAKFDEVHLQNGDIIPADDCKNCESSLEQYGLSAVCMNKASDVRKQEENALYSKNAEEYLEPMGMKKYELVDMYPVNWPVSKPANQFCLDPESPWIGGSKTELWWRTTDKDELASLVMETILRIVIFHHLRKSLSGDTHMLILGALTMMNHWHHLLIGRPKLVMYRAVPTLGKHMDIKGFHLNKGIQILVLASHSEIPQQPESDPGLS